MSEDHQNSSAPRPKQNRLLLGKLYEKQSQGGQRYFQGVLGFLKVLVFHDDKAESGNEWNFYVVERDPADVRPKGQYSIPPQAQQPNAVGQQGSYGATTPARQQYGSSSSPGAAQQGYPPRQLPPEGGQLDDSIPF